MNLSKVGVIFLTIMLVNTLFVDVFPLVFLPLILPILNFAIKAMEVYNFATSLIDMVTPSNGKANLAYNSLGEYEALMKHIELVNNFTQSILETKDLLTKYITLQPTMDKVTKYQNIILTRYKQMLLYKEQQLTLDSASLLDFARTAVLPGSNSMQFILDMYHLSLLGPKDSERYKENIFTQLARSHKDLYGPDRTSKFMHSFYTDIVETQLKGYSVLGFSWLILRLLKKGTFKMEKMLAHEELRERLERTERMFRKAITWKCEPPKESKGKKRSEFQKLLEGFEKDEVIMISSGSCLKRCEDKKNSDVLGGAADEYCNPQNECKGRLYECDYSGGVPMVCLSPGKGKRTVDLVKYNDGEVEVNNVNCY